jgi:tetratricopeptide (TPR) repeat protein
MHANYRNQVLCFVAIVQTLLLAGCGQTPTAQPPGPDEPSSTAQEHFREGNDLSRAGEFDKAAEQYEKALETDPEYVDAMTNLGVAYYNLGQLDKAIEQYNKAIKIAPSDADIRSNLAAAHVQKHQSTSDPEELDRAVEQYEKAIELNPDLAEAHFGLGVIYALQDENAQAIRAFERFLELDQGQDPMATSNAEEYLKQLKGQ